MRSFGGSAPFRMSPVNRLFVLLLATLAVGCGEHRILTGTDASHRRSRSLSDQSAFRLLRGPTKSLPQRVRSQLARSLHGGSRDEFRPAHIHRALTAVGVVWTFFDGSALCLADSHGSVACAKAGRARSKGVILGTFTPPSKRVPRPHDFLVVGLVPEPIRKTVVTFGKQHRTLAVRRNLFPPPVIARSWLDGLCAT